MAEATDVIGEFCAWRAAGLPIEPASRQASNAPESRRFLQAAHGSSLTATPYRTCRSTLTMLLLRASPSPKCE